MNASILCQNMTGCTRSTETVKKNGIQTSQIQRETCTNYKFSRCKPLSLQGYRKSSNWYITLSKPDTNRLVFTKSNQQLKQLLMDPNSWQQGYVMTKLSIYALHYMPWVYHWKRQLGCWVTIVPLSLHLQSRTLSWENTIMHFHTIVCMHPLPADISNSVTLMVNKTLPTF